MLDFPYRFRYTFYMSDIIGTNHDFIFSIADDAQFEQIRHIGVALSSTDRLRILQLLSVSPMTLSELSKALDLAVSSVSYHIDALTRAQLIFVDYQPGPKGHTKLCSKMAMSLKVDFCDIDTHTARNITSVEMPVGSYVECDITAPCGIADGNGVIGDVDDPHVLFMPERLGAQLLWFQSGHVSYNFPNDSLKKSRVFRSVDFSLELCSETVYYRNDWPSDVTVWINDTEIATYTVPGDFGGRRGKYTPEYWFINSTQYGLLKHFTVNDRGVFIDDQPVNNAVTFDSLNLSDGTFIRFTIGIKPDAKHVGGLNLFGAGFGDYPQAIVMTLSE